MLGATYSLITKSLWQGMRAEHALKNHMSFDSAQSCMYCILASYITIEMIRCVQSKYPVDNTDIYLLNSFLRHLSAATHSRLMYRNITSLLT